MDLVVIDGLAYLASPWPTDPEAFWEAVWSSGSRMVVNLAGDSMKYLTEGGRTMQVRVDEEEAQGAVWIRHLSLSKGSMEKRMVHIEFPGWVDFGVPPRESFLSLLETVEEFSEYPEAPITVHCLAGCGRTGTFIAAHLLRKLQSPPAMPDLLRRLRDQRKGLVETAQQERFAESFRIQGKEQDPLP